MYSEAEGQARTTTPFLPASPPHDIGKKRSRGVLRSLLSLFTTPLSRTKVLMPTKATSLCNSFRQFAIQSVALYEVAEMRSALSQSLWHYACAHSHRLLAG